MNKYVVVPTDDREFDPFRVLSYLDSYFVEADSSYDAALKVQRLLTEGTYLHVFELGDKRPLTYKGQTIMMLQP